MKIAEYYIWLLSLNVCIFRLKLSVNNLIMVPYFFSYNTDILSFQNKPKNLDPSFKRHLDLWDCLGRIKLVL